MKRVMLVLLIPVAYIGIEYREGIVDLYRAAYPGDPAKRDALEQCSRGIRNFDRFASADRDSCYASILGRAFVSAEPYNPSHLPANDIRRQEVFDGYRSAQGAFTVSIVPPPSRTYLSQ